MPVDWSAGVIAAVQRWRQFAPDSRPRTPWRNLGQAAHGDDGHLILDRYHLLFAPYRQA